MLRISRKISVDQKIHHFAQTIEIGLRAELKRFLFLRPYFVVELKTNK